MSYNIVTIESLLADSLPTSNYTWSEKFPNLSSLSPNIKYEGDKKLLLKKYSTYNDFSNTFGKEVLRRTKRAFIDYRSLKYAMSQLSWEEKYFPNSIRATIHQKQQDILGLRIYPEYKKASKLLPYHGIAVLKTLDGNDCMLIQPEINAASQTGVKRYINNYNFSDFYIA
ncbi:hypothetical protein U0021_05250 [Moraxella canis]|uniref:Uncharacterized protein n=1 Tax=Moraxella canis TaxID=90239 RepID=A0ABZ0WVA5_9GAMM|nr:hypothetical protein [Moraxella canis]WQE03182.1 hypothetical protein U0021_05250 [Moraxella canis]